MTPMLMSKTLFWWFTVVQYHKRATPWENVFWFAQSTYDQLYNIMGIDERKLTLLFMLFANDRGATQPVPPDQRLCFWLSVKLVPFQLISVARQPRALCCVLELDTLPKALLNSSGSTQVPKRLNNRWLGPTSSISAYEIAWQFWASTQEKPRDARRHLNGVTLAGRLSFGLTYCGIWILTPPSSIKKTTFKFDLSDITFWIRVWSQLTQVHYESMPCGFYPNTRHAQVQRVLSEGVQL